jgi:hypothetical protein
MQELSQVCMTPIDTSILLHAELDGILQFSYFYLASNACKCVVYRLLQVCNTISSVITGILMLRFVEMMC